MSYDLNFWKQKTGVKLDPQVTYEKLSNGEAVSGLENIPTEMIRERVKIAFQNGWDQLDSDTWESSEEAKGFQIFTTPQFFRVDCGGMTGDEMNVFIDIADEFGCPLYDPAVGKRFDGTD